MRGPVRQRLLGRGKNPYVFFERGRSALSPFARRLGQFRRKGTSPPRFLLALSLAAICTTLASCDSSMSGGGSGSEIPAIAIVVIDRNDSSPGQAIGAKEWRIWRISNESGEPRLVLVAVLRDSSELLRLPSTAGYYLAEGWSESSGSDTVPSVINLKSTVQSSAIASCMQQIDRIPQGDTARVSLCRDTTIAPSAGIASLEPNYLVVFKLALEGVKTQRVFFAGDSASRPRPTHWRLWSVDSAEGDSMRLSFAGNHYSDPPWGGEVGLPLVQTGKQWLIEAWSVDPSTAKSSPSTTIPLVAHIDRDAYSACRSKLVNLISATKDSIALERCPDGARLSPSSLVPGSRAPDAVSIFPSGPT